MGILGNSQSFSCFWAGPSKGIDDVSKWVVECISKYSFREEIGGLSKKMGWTTPFEPFSPELPETSILLGDFAIFALRIDERKVPKALLKKYLALEEKRYKEEKGIKRLPRVTKKRLREQVEFMLLQKVLPVPSVYDVAWDLKEEVVYFFSTSSKVIGDFQAFFKKTFQIMPEPMVPYTLAEVECGKEVLSAIGPERFV